MEATQILKLDSKIAAFMKRWRITALRLSLGIIFFWFGILKPFGLSPAEPLVLKTTSWLPFFEPYTWLSIIGWWEVAIGVLFVIPSLTRVAIGLLATQMVGTFLPLFLLPEITFQAGHIPYAPTLEGQYIIKNLLIIAAALAVGATVRTKKSGT